MLNRKFGFALKQFEKNKQGQRLTAVFSLEPLAERHQEERASKHGLGRVGPVGSLESSSEERPSHTEKNRASDSEPPPWECLLILAPVEGGCLGV